MKRVLLLVVLFFFISITYVNAQRGQRGGERRGGTISGTVIDASTDHTIEYSNIVLFNSEDSSQVTGTITDENGKFKLTGIRPGSYYIKVGFIGFTDLMINDIEMKAGNMNMDLGEIELKPESFNLEDVVVEGDRVPISYEIDKKVINVKGMNTAASGNAADILENVPSVTVDIEGNVSLRGSGSFTVLIDGRPTIMDASDALEQIPASAIENIEIITNPSVKHDPEGTAGIINIIMKKNSRQGTSGVLSLNGGLQDRYGVEGLVEYRKGPLGLSFEADYNNRNRDFTYTSRNEAYRNGMTTFMNSTGDFDGGRESYGFRGSIDYRFTEADVITLGGRYGNRDGGRYAERYYRKWTTVDPEIDDYITFGDRGRGGDHYAFFSNYEHKFNNNGHRLVADIQYSYGDFSERTESLVRRDGSISEGQLSTESGPGHEFETEIEYTLPLGENSKFEAGYESELDDSEEANGYYSFNTATGAYDFVPAFSNTTDYRRNEHSLFALYAGMIGNLGYQGGLRAEYTDRYIELLKTGENFTVDRWDYFPSIHFSYKLGGGHQLMASYTGRIDRPRGWYLEPFETWVDANSVRRGNPALEPEFIDSYELGYQTHIGNTMISLEGYYRTTENKIERIRQLYRDEDDVYLGTMENVGNDYALGVESMFNFDLFDFWNVNLMGNLYDYRVEGELLGQNFDNSSFSWSARFNNSFEFGKDTQIQFFLMYHGPEVEAQEEEEGFLMTSAALKRDFFNKKLSLTLQVRDLFSTGKHESESFGPDFYNYSHFERESPVVTLNAKFNINNYKDEKHKGGGQGDGMSSGPDDDF